MSLSDQISLIVDSNSANSKSVASILRNDFKSRTVFSSNSARQAMDIARQQPRIDWIFADTDLVDLNGFDFLEGVRQLPNVRNASVILMSTRRDKETLMRAASAGVTDYIAKPFNAATLISKLRRHLDGKDKRSTERLTTLAVFDIDISFDNVVYAGKLMDISLGGCLTRAAPFKRGPTCVFDVAELTVKHESGNVFCRGELARMERYTDPDTQEKFVAAGFQFSNLTDEMQSHISRFIGAIGNGPKKEPEPTVAVAPEPQGTA